MNTIDDLIMLEIIHKNHVSEEKKETRLNVLDKLLLGFSTSIFMLGVMTLISIIENLKF